MCTKLYSLDKFANFRGVTLGSHSDAIRAIFFEKKSLDLITIARYDPPHWFVSFLQIYDYKNMIVIIFCVYILTGMVIFVYGKAALILLTWSYGSHHGRRRKRLITVTVKMMYLKLSLVKWRLRVPSQMKIWKWKRMVVHNMFRKKFPFMN